MGPAQVKTSHEHVSRAESSSHKKVNSLKSKTSRPPARRSSDSEDVDTPEDDREAMLAALQAHSRALFGLPDPTAESSGQAQRRGSGAESDLEGEEGEERDEYMSDDGWGADDGFVSDSEDEFAPPLPAGASGVARLAVPEVVFAQSSRSEPDLLSKSERRAFLNGNSAKMMGLANPSVTQTKRTRDQAEASLEDQSNMKLDKTLHSMLLTTLLPSHTSNTATRPSEKRNAVSGRLMELANFSLPGEGTASLKSTSLSTHPAKIRTGLIHAQAKREEKARVEAEAAGHVRGLKGKGSRDDRGGDKEKRRRLGLGEEVRKKGMDGRKGEIRDRGLGSGIGRFEGGMLKISKGDIRKVNQEKEGFRGKRGKGRR